MTLIDESGSGTSGAFTDTAGQSISWTSSIAHSVDVPSIGINDAALVSDGQTNTYMFDNGDGGVPKAYQCNSQACQMLLKCSIYRSMVSTLI